MSQNLIYKGQLYIISAPSGAGKTSLVKALVKSTPHVSVSVSHTTRVQRQGEIQGVNYHFVSLQEFEAMLEQGVFSEFAQVFGNYYGTFDPWVKKQIEEGIDVILEIDWQGARQIRSHMPEAVSIFILPPSREVLYERLVGRKQDAIEEIKSRMTKAVDEISHYNEFDYLIINDEFDLALRDIQTIIRSRRLTINWQTKYRAEAIKQLMQED